MSKGLVPSLATRQQIDALSLNSRPLIICDVDEVLLHFIRGLENHLTRNGYWLDAKSFALTGNIRRQDNNLAADFEKVQELLTAFLHQDSGSLDAIDGARDALASIADVADIVLLTNVPEKLRSSRISNLDSHGFDHPVITNEGLKGPAAIEIAKKSGVPVFFLDDTPTNVESVRDALPEAHIIHFIADVRFSSVLAPVDGVHLRTGNWNETHSYIRNVINQTNGK